MICHVGGLEMEMRQARLRVAIVGAFLVVFALITSDSLLRASSPASTIQITSPSHPRTFYVSGYEKLAQDLSWEKKDGILTGKVTYSIIMGGGDALFDPANYRTFDLPFPGVHRAANSLYLQRDRQKVYVGHLEQGAFGTQVKLNSNVQFVAHRRDGELWGELILSSPG
jgi:hypothetical protein